MIETSVDAQVELAFEVPCRLLLERLKIVSGMIEHSQVMQILSHIKIQVDGNKLQILATDSEAQITTELMLEKASEKAGSVAVSCRKMLDICRTLPVDGVVVCEVSGGWLTLRVERAHFTLATLPVDQFPQLVLSESVQTLCLEEQALKYLIANTHFAMAEQDVRFYLNGLLLTAENEKVQAWATDAHRLAMAEMPAKKIEKPIRSIVPRKTVLELGKLLEESDEEVKLSISAQHMHVQTKRFEMISSLIEGDYPDCQQLIPHHEDVCGVSTDRMVFKQALDRAMVLSHEKFRAAKLDVSTNQMVIHAHNADQEKTDDVISVQSSSQDNISMSFNIRYLQDIVSVLDAPEITLQFVAKHESLCIEEEQGDGHKLFVVMSLMF